MILTRICSAILALSAVFCTTRGVHAQAASPNWVGTWGASPSSTTQTMYQGMTIRQTIHTTVGGTQYRIRLSNDLSSAPVTIGPVLASVPGSSPGSINTQFGDPVLFGGSSTVTIPAHGSVVSDTVLGTIFSENDFTISFYVVAETTGLTQHDTALATGFYALGNQVTSPTLTNPQTITQRLVLAGIDFLQPGNAAATLVTLGDSITDGFQSTPDTNHRWPDFLALRILPSTLAVRPGVVNAGVSTNELLHDDVNPGALSRLSRDVFAVPNLRYICVLIGINDIGLSFNQFFQRPLAASDLIQGYKQIIDKAHELNVKVIMGTITPVGGSTAFSPAEEVIRKQVNAWIRTGQGFDGVVDFDAVLSDPSVPSQLLAGYSSSDFIHPNDAGYKAMANAFNLSLLGN